MTQDEASACAVPAHAEHAHSTAVTPQFPIPSLLSAGIHYCGARQADRQAGRQAGRQADRQAGSQADQQAGRGQGDLGLRQHHEQLYLSPYVTIASRCLQLLRVLRLALYCAVLYLLLPLLGFGVLSVRSVLHTPPHPVCWFCPY